MNLIFDFDGTICDSFDLTISVTNEYLKRHGKKLVNPVDFREKGIEGIIRDYKLSKLQILLYIYKGRRELAKHIGELKTFPEMKEVISKLSQKHTLGIISSNSKKNIQLFLDKNDLSGFFKFVYSSPTIFWKSRKIELAVKKYKFAKEETVYIGDEARDIEAAKKAGVKSAAVTWGFADKKLLIRFKPDILVERPNQLSEIVK